MKDTLNKKEIMELLPHRDPMLLIDELKNIKKLLTSLSTLIKNDFFPENRISCSSRQVHLLEKSKDILLLAYKDFSSNDLVQTVSLLRASLEEMKEIVGEVYNEEILNRIFADFCVGK